MKGTPFCRVRQFIEAMERATDIDASSIRTNLGENAAGLNCRLNAYVQQVRLRFSIGLLANLSAAGGAGFYWRKHAHSQLPAGISAQLSWLLWQADHHRAVPPKLGHDVVALGKLGRIGPRQPPLDLGGVEPPRRRLDPAKRQVR